MKENKDSFDEHIQSRLSDFESPVPTDLFDRLQAQRGGALSSDASLRDRLDGYASPVSDKIFDKVLSERKRRNRRVWLWRSATAMAALWLLGVVVIRLNNNNSEINTSKGIENSANTEGVADVKNGSATAEKSTISGTSITKITESASNNVEINAGLKNENLAESTSKSRSNSANTEGVSNSGFQTSDDKKPTTSGFTSLTPSGFEFKNKNEALNGVAENDLTSFNRTLSSFEGLATRTPQMLILAKEARKNPCTNPDNGCPSFGIRRRGMGEKAFYVDVFVAPEYIMRSFIKNLPESEKLLVARDSVERTQYAVSSGVRASFILGNGLAIRAGALYNQINEKARFDSLGIGTITTTYKVNSLPNGQLDTVSVIRTVTDGIFRKTRYNHYRTIDIPVQIGFEKNLKNGWGIGVNGGAIFNITAWRKADIVGSDLRQQTVSSGINQPNPVFNTRLGVSLIGSVAVYRQLTNNLQAVVEPTLRYGLQPITRTDYALKQQYSTVGLLIGLRLKI
ncbi:MAG: hypothetical protein U5L45_26490 [Saprospiraceae bacterium]|nr:hypothetical protein [Saprospiraceae bacterium]